MFERDLRSCKIVELLAGVIEHRSSPQNINQTDAYLFSHEYKRQIDACNAIKLSNVDIFGPTWLQLPNLIPVDGYRHWNGQRNLRRQRLKSLMKLFTPPRVIDCALWVHDDWSGGYFHWLTEVCPKLIAWRNSQKALFPVLLPSEFRNYSYVLSTLDILGFKYLFFEPLDRIFVRVLWIIEPTAISGNYRSDLMKQISEQVTKKLGSPLLCQNSSNLNYYYISRKDATRRFLANEEDIKDLLKSRSIKPLVLSGYNLADQVSTFSQCSLLVSIHGNALTNMLWMPTGSSVIEIRRSGDKHNNCYYSLASALGHKYYYIQAPSVDKSQDTHTANLEVNPDDLDLTIQHALYT